MVNVQINVGDSYIIMIVDFDNAQEAILQYVEEVNDFWEKVLGGRDRIEDYNHFDNFVLGGIWNV